MLRQTTLGSTAFCDLMLVFVAECLNSFGAAAAASPRRRVAASLRHGGCLAELGTTLDSCLAELGPIT